MHWGTHPSPPASTCYGCSIRILFSNVNDKHAMLYLGDGREVATHLSRLFLDISSPLRNPNYNYYTSNTTKSRKYSEGTAAGYLFCGAWGTAISCLRRIKIISQDRINFMNCYCTTTTVTCQTLGPGTFLRTLIPCSRSQSDIFKKIDIDLFMMLSYHINFCRFFA